MISNIDPIASKKPALILSTPGRELELILDDTKYRVVAILIPHRIDMGRIEIAFAVGGGELHESKPLATIWDQWAVLADVTWAEKQIKARASRPRGYKVILPS